MNRGRRPLRKISGTAWQRVRVQVLERDGYACQACGRHGHMEIDHIVPFHHGGTDAMENLQALCRDCHFKKTKQDLASDIPGKKEWLTRVI